MICRVSCVTICREYVLLDAHVFVEVRYYLVQCEVGWHLETPFSLVARLLVYLGKGWHFIVMRDEDDAKALALELGLLLRRELRLERIWKDAEQLPDALRILRITVVLPKRPVVAGVVQGHELGLRELPRVDPDAVQAVCSQVRLLLLVSFDGNVVIVVVQQGSSDLILLLPVQSFLRPVHDLM